MYKSVIRILCILSDNRPQKVGDHMSGSQESKDKYLKEKVDTIVIRVPKGQKQVIQEFAKSRGKSLNAFVYELIQAEMSKQKNI